MSELLFYHLTSRSLTDVLPGLLETSLKRGWRSVVQTESAERVKYLNDHLWTFRDDSFLPHGSSEDEAAALQPIWLCESEENPNNATIRFMVDGTALSDPTPYSRVIYLFDGNNQDLLERARAQWKHEKKLGRTMTYWAQNEQGRWEKKQ